MADAERTMGGVSTDCDGHMRWGDDVIEGEDIDAEFQRWGRSRGATKCRQQSKLYPEHRRVRGGEVGGRERLKGLKGPVIKGRMGVLSRDITWGNIKMPRRI